MLLNSICPVPRNQQPIIEYENLSQSWFFRIPTVSFRSFYLHLVVSWLLILPIILIIMNGSVTFHGRLIKLIYISALLSVISPLLVLVRQYLGWTYIHGRLSSDVVEYEETGWYDGQIWQKPIEVQAKEKLIARYDVSPIISLLKKYYNLFAYLDIEWLVFIP